MLGEASEDAANLGGVFGMIFGPVDGTEEAVQLAVDVLEVACAGVESDLDRTGDSVPEHQVHEWYCLTLGRTEAKRSIDTLVVGPQDQSVFITGLWFTGEWCVGHGLPFSYGVVGVPGR
ncbi:hypothetical protein J8M97_08530 [Gordonia polyisoprenivorans]|uniref:hypothetical protein n=1 Tax=Gordonia polyisoprenivorans TaxID=84595 RepID=UPI001B8AD002|nr:hypothetical protein [Gordonia polyisoprenivorans]QUD84610.1 hypothetical protein J8M97_08530 [Gordonia polyisoprenivorans]